MKRYGLIGYPLTHSLSQQYFTSKFIQEGIEDCIYERFSIPSIVDLHTILNTHKDLCGFNITIPYKKEVLAFLNAYRPIYLDAQKINVPSFAFSRIKNAFTRFHYYFPEYTLPKKLVYFIGPLESYSNILFKDGLAIGLQMHLGSNAPWYYSEQIQTIYPPYMSRNFVPANVVVVSMQNILEDYVSGTTHTNTSGKTLLIQMIDAGKKQYILNQLLPQEADSTKWGYTNMQLKTLATEESSIFDYLLQQKILFSVAPEDSRNMMQMAANNSLFGASIPGDAGRFIGYKMVQSWMEKKGASINLQQLLAAPAENIYTESGYKP